MIEELGEVELSAFDRTCERIAKRALECARQVNPRRKPYAAVMLGPGIHRRFVNSDGRFRDLTEQEDREETNGLLATIFALPLGGAVEYRDANNCTSSIDQRELWIRIDTELGWKHEVTTGHRYRNERNQKW